jgi:hypothetical protein
MRAGWRSARLVATALFSAALGACSAALSGVDTASVKPVADSITHDFVPGVPKGYQCPLVPNGFDPVGSIYRLDKDNTYYRVKDFTTDASVNSTVELKRVVKISNYALSDTQKATAGLSFEILKNALPGLSASGSADYKKEVTVDITVEDLVGEVIDDTVADRIVGLFKANIQPKPGNKYFLVREAVRAGAISYQLKQTDLAKLGSKADVEKLAQGAANVTVRDNNGVFEIKQTFMPERIPVCIKSAEIVIDGANGTRSAEDVTVSLKSMGETKVPVIKRVGAN